jgi:DNA-binding CsgD family transcriptional regulator/tetratricopeptide (TPR) repeat protein
MGGPAGAPRIIPAMARRLSSPVFIGRSTELEALRQAAAAAESGRASLVLVGGEAGVGKSRLLGELTARGRADGWRVLEGATISVGADGLPFEPIVAALRSVARELGADRVASLAGPSLGDLARLVPELAASGTHVPMPVSQAEWLQVRTFEGVLGLLGRLGESAPVMLVIEDLHWADRSTKDLLTFLARNGRTERLLIVGSFRTDELHRRHPLVGWLAEVERLPRVDRLDLRRFDRGELGELLGGILGISPAPALVATIADRSDGNAFFAEELASGLDEAGAGRLPATLREIVLARLAGLSDPATRLVEVAAVAGREVDHDLLAEVVSVSETEILGALREAVSSHLLVTVGEGSSERYRFRHALVQEAVYEDMLPSDRRQLHGAYARAIESHDDGAGQSSAGRLVELAHHWSAAHQQARALHAAIEAADASRSTFAFAEAAGMYERAIDLWDLVPADDRPADRDLGGLFDSAAAMVSMVGDPSRAVALAERAIQELDAIPGDVVLERRAAARERLGRAAWLAGDGAGSIAALEEAVALLADAPPSIARARVEAGLAATIMLAGRVRESQPIAERAIESARAIDAIEVESHALSTLGVDRGSLGAVAEGTRLLQRGLELALAIAEPTAIGRAYANLGTVRQMGGDLEGAVRTYVEGIDASVRHGNVRTFGTFLAINAAGAYILLGRHGDAAAMLERAEEGGLLPGVATIHFSITRAELRVRTGELDGARADLAVARDEAAAVEDVQFAGDLEGVTAELALEEEDPGAAVTAIRRGFERIGAGIDPRILGPIAAFGLRAAADLAVTARARRDETGAEAAVAAAREFLGRYRDGIATIAEPDEGARAEHAWVHALLQAELARAEARDLVEAWLAIQPALAARPTPYLEAYVLWRAADAAAPSDQARAAEALRSAHEIATRIDAPRMAARIEGLARRRRVDLGRGAVPGPEPAQPSADVDPYHLTAREREILALLAEGYTNRRLAQTLFISESTAGVHVSNILGKLGVASRTEAATLAVRLGLDRPPAA